MQGTYPTPPFQRPEATQIYEINTIIIILILSKNLGHPNESSFCRLVPPPPHGIFLAYINSNYLALLCLADVWFKLKINTFV